VVFSFGFACL